MSSFVFDIETGPLPEAELAAAFTPFDPAEVKLGNLKDPEKIRAKLAEAEIEHAQSFRERAALDPLTGQVLAVGFLYRETGEFVALTNPGTPEGEAALLKSCWEFFRGDMQRINQMVGFNTLAFDLPFLVRRSWKHRIALPFALRKGRYWSEQMVDLREVWQMGDRMAKGSLDAIGKCLGVGGKTGNGKDFAALLAADPLAALAYLENDVRLTAQIADILIGSPWGVASQSL